MQRLKPSDISAALEQFGQRKAPPRQSTNCTACRQRIQLPPTPRPQISKATPPDPAPTRAYKPRRWPGSTHILLEMIIYLSAQSRLNKNGISVHPSQGYLARKTGYSLRTVGRRLKDLEKAGYIKRWKQYKINDQWQPREIFIGPRARQLLKDKIFAITIRTAAKGVSKIRRIQEAVLLAYGRITKPNRTRSTFPDWMQNSHSPPYPHRQTQIG